MKIAALYVQRGGVYFGLPDVDPWDEQRDARQYAGPWPVVAHPPCERWGRYWHGGPNSARFPRVRRERGDDGGCFAAALAAVRTWGGVLEHPEASSAWRHFGLMVPPRDGGWVSAGLGDPGWTCCVEQGSYGHRARKATWLYACHAALPSLHWGASGAAVRMDDGYHSAEERRERSVERLAKRERLATPVPFRDLLISIARSARTPTPVASRVELPASTELRACAWCRSEIAATARVETLFCSRRCRQSAYRLRRRRTTAATAHQPMRFAYADPPYPGCARKYYQHEDTYAGEVDHAALIASLEASGYDGWALSTSAKALRDILPMCPEGARVCSWMKPHGASSRSLGLHNVWEPLIVVRGRQLQPGKPDALRAQAARGGGSLPGRKPLAFCAWLFDCLGMLPGDELVDLFPGSGVVGRAWAEVSRSAEGDAFRAALDDAGSSREALGYGMPVILAGGSFGGSPSEQGP